MQHPKTSIYTPRNAVSRRLKATNFRQKWVLDDIEAHCSFDFLDPLLMLKSLGWCNFAELSGHRICLLPVYSLQCFHFISFTQNVWSSFSPMHFLCCHLPSWPHSPPFPLRMRTCSHFAVIFLYRTKVDFPEASLAFIWYVLQFSHSLPRFSVSMRNLFAFRLFSLPNTSWFTRSFQMSIL